MPDVRGGMFRGFVIGLALGFLRILGHERGADSSFEDQYAPVTYWVLWFVLGMPVAGAIAGFLRHFASTWIGSVWVGIVATIPLAVAADFFLTSGSPTEPTKLLAMALWNILMGGGCGLALHFIYKRIWDQAAARRNQ
jgi:hypothetical protein